MKKSEVRKGRTVYIPSQVGHSSDMERYALKIVDGKTNWTQNKGGDPFSGGKSGKGVLVQGPGPSDQPYVRLLSQLQTKKEYEEAQKVHQAEQKRLDEAMRKEMDRKHDLKQLIHEVLAPLDLCASHKRNGVDVIIERDRVCLRIPTKVDDQKLLKDVLFMIKKGGRK